MKVVLSGGGTGGHIYPALALRKYILTQYPDAEFLYIGTQNGLENEIVRVNGIDFETVKIQGIKRSFSLENIKTLFYAVKSVSKAKKILKKFKPDIVIGTGGYVCFPVVFAAARLKIPAIIHEQNSVAGVTSKVLARFAKKICICFEAVRSDFKKYADKVVLTGNPRGQELIDSEANPHILNELGLCLEKKTVLFFGGSRGAANLNQHIIDHYALYAQMNVQIIFVTGAIHYDKVCEKIQETNTFKIVPYLNNMTEILRVVDLVVCRSGATTLAELTALGVASILIPSPYVTNNHQEKNARSLVDKQAAEIVLEKELATEKLYHYVYDLTNNDYQLKKMARAAKKMGITDASCRILDIIETIV